MPFRSEQQRRYLYARHPEIATRWTAEARRMSELKDRFTKEKRASVLLLSAILGALAARHMAKRKERRK